MSSSLPPPVEDPATARVLERSLELLVDVFGSSDRYLLSNESLTLFLRKFGSKLIERSRRGEGEATLNWWKRHVEKFREDLLSVASAEPLRLTNKEEVPVLTEQKARRLLGGKPDPPDFPS